MHEISSKYKRKKSESESFFLNTKTVPNTIGTDPISRGVINFGDMSVSVGMKVNPHLTLMALAERLGKELSGRQ